MVLAGSINKELVSWINQAGGRAVGISGKDANFVTASKVQRTTRDPGSLIEQAVDLGFVGEPSKVDRSLLDTLSRSAEHTSELPSLMRISYDVFCLKKKTTI